MPDGDDAKAIGWVESRVTGGHWAFRNPGKKPFTNKMTEAKTVRLDPTDVVADIGGYVGEYAMYAARRGVQHVHTYEPTPDTFRLLRRNTERYPNITAHNRAVTGDAVDSVTLHTSPGIGVTNSIAKGGKKGESLTVPAVQYQRAVAGATVVKIDVEGAEYGYDIIQPHLRAYIIEWHPITGWDWQSYATALMDRIESMGFRPTVRRPRFANGWDLHGAWVRAVA